MRFVPLEEMTPEHWYQAWSTMYDPKTADHVGVNPEITAARPPLETFYVNIMNAHRTGIFRAWAILKDSEFKGYTLLDKSAVGEWEVVTVLPNPADWGSGIGARATIHAVKWAFETDDANWVIAFTQGKDPKIPKILHRAGFRPFANFHVMDKETWDARWRARSDRQ
jgi:RimJ/RimL family protein N-acetyltransferase